MTCHWSTQQNISCRPAYHFLLSSQQNALLRQFTNVCQHTTAGAFKNIAPCACWYEVTSTEQHNYRLHCDQSRHTQTDTQTYTDRHTDIHRQTHRDTHWHTQTDTQRHIQTGTNTQAHTDRHRDTHRHTDRHRQTRTGTHTHIHTDRHRRTQTHTNRHGQTHTYTHRQTQTHTDTHRHTQTVSYYVTLLGCLKNIVFTKTSLLLCRAMEILVLRVNRNDLAFAKSKCGKSQEIL